MPSAPAHLSQASLTAAWASLDRRLGRPWTLIVGGGTAMMLAHGLPVRTTDVDAYPAQGSFEELAPLVREVAAECGLSPDWLNPHFETFAHLLPADYRSRLKPVFSGARLTALALGLEDLLVMKCFAGREKDVGHARALLARGPDLSIVERRIQELVDRGVKGASSAADFLDDVAEAK